MIYNACQIGIRVNLEDLSFHTLIALNEYASNLLDDKNTTPATDIASLRKQKAKG